MGLELLTLLAAVTPLLPAGAVIAPSESGGLQTAKSKPEEGPTDDELRAAFHALDDARKFEACEWFRAECLALESFRYALLRWVLGQQDRDSGTWPTASRPEWFDPAVHAPAQPIPRHWLPEDDARAVRARERLLKEPRRRLDSAWSYDWATGGLVHDGRVRDLARIFENGLAGFPPDLDLAEALVLRTLDHSPPPPPVGVAPGTEAPPAPKSKPAPGTAEAFGLRGHFAAFAHAYTDRSGNAYPGITLYDAYASGAEVEMPDVDTLGIVHTLLGDWRTRTAPVRNQGPLYEKVGALHRAAARHRGLREALARTYFTATPALAGGYAEAVDSLHLLWNEQDSTPERLRDTLPSPDEWAKYLENAAKRLKSREVALATKARRDALQADSARVRAILVRVLEGLHALPAPGGGKAPGKQR